MSKRKHIPASALAEDDRRLKADPPSWETPGVDEIVSDDLSTIPEVLRDLKPVKMTTHFCRMHPDDSTVMKALLRKDRISWQKFFTYCAQGFMDADPYFLKFLKMARERDLVPQRLGKQHVLSNRARSQIYEELEQQELTQAPKKESDR